ncbi:MAG: response regulator [candidate division NC10 bacterium]|nr:response regulator [candidate division NC10 bacterium]
MNQGHNALWKRPTVLVVDDNPQNVELLAAWMTAEGYQVASAGDGQVALEQVAVTSPDLILLDIMMPKVDGYAVCRELKARPETRLVPIVLLTALGAEEHRLQGIEAGADDFLTKPVSPSELKARVRALLKLKAFTDELEHAEAVFRALAVTIALRDRYTGGHCERLARYGAALAKRLGLPEAEITTIARGAFLHDLGKVRVPDVVLLKPGPLLPEERAVMAEHPVTGADLLRSLKTFQGAVTIVRHHHEKYDGSGYPDGLAGDAIPLSAQIVAIVDVYDALTTTRPYRVALSHQEAVRVLGEEVEKGWRHPELVEVFIAMVEEERENP